MSGPKTVSDAAIEEMVVGLATARGAGKTICPSEAARALVGDDPQVWSRLMPAVRRAAVRMMKRGEVAITRKGRPVDPDDFKGVYRIGIGRTDPDGGGAGSS